MGGLALASRLFPEFSNCREGCFQHTRRQPVKNLGFSGIVAFNGLCDIAGALINRLACCYFEGRNGVDLDGLGGTEICLRHALERTPRRYPALMDRMPVPGDLHRGFFKAPGRCFRMVYSDQLQATHCYEKPSWKGVWRDAKGKSHYVEACRGHAPKSSPVSAVETQG